MGNGVEPIAEEMLDDTEDTEDTEGKTEYTVDDAAQMLVAALCRTCLPTSVALRLNPRF